MREYYEKNTAEYQRNYTDTFFNNYGDKFELFGLSESVSRFISEHQIMKTELWERFVRQYKVHTDTENGWRGEYWGKMMRGACFNYCVTKDKALFLVLKKTVSDMLDIQKSEGRLSSYPVEKEFTAWDIWCRKYVLLGMEYFLEISDDAEFNKKIVASLCAQVDDIMSKIGDGEGKTPIAEATNHWRGLNSCSLLEPIVRLYSITKEKRFFDFASYIVSCGGTDIFNIFDAAYENHFMPYQYPVTKAYEMMSCFEGALEYYRITGEEKYKIAVINFIDRVLETDFTVIGSCGCTHELFDHSAVRQANTTNDFIMQETCVTVTIMKLLYQLNLLTGDSKYADALEISAYNAYLGSLNTEHNPDCTKATENMEREPLPFDSYSPLVADSRGKQIGGFRPTDEKHYYGCCACIGSAGNGIFLKSSVLSSKKGIVLNYFTSEKVTTKTPENGDVTLSVSTEYPRLSDVSVEISLNKAEKFEISVRNPAWSNNTKVFVNGESVPACKGYISVERVWQNGDEIKITFEMDVIAIHPISYGSQILNNKVAWGGKNYIVPTFDIEDPLAKNHIALRRGPVILAQDSRLGYNVENPCEISVPNDDRVNFELSEKSPFETTVFGSVPLKNKERLFLADYGSSGKLWNEKSKVAAWILVK